MIFFVLLEPVVLEVAIGAVMEKLRKACVLDLKSSERSYSRKNFNR